jgi:octaprenyl-diphosphate synthase
MSSTAFSPALDFASIRKLVEPESNAVDQLILQELSSDVVLINQIGHYIVNSGGKRLRPMLLLLAAKALGCEDRHQITLAAVIEFIHTATLLHDDVVDESTLRRGKDTANALWGNSASVLVGDYLYSRSFELMVRVHKLKVMEILSQTTTSIAEGEVLQLLNCNNPATTEQKYLEVICRKTAILFSAALQLAAVLSNADEVVEAALKDYGLHLGIAFQLIDDALDYRADPQSHVLRNAIENGNREAFRAVFEIVEATDAISYTSRRAVEEAEKAIAALAVLPDSKYREALVQLARFSVERNY